MKKLKKRTLPEEEKDDYKNKVLELLPSDLLLKILSTLPTIPLMHYFKATLGQNNIENPDPLLFLLNRKATGAYPCLIMNIIPQEPCPNQLYFFDPNSSEGKTKSSWKYNLGEEFQTSNYSRNRNGFSWVGACNGLICVYIQNLNSLLLWNPFGRNSTPLKVQVYKNKVQDQQDHFFDIGYDSTEKSFKVIGVFSGGRVFVVTIGSKKLWRKKGSWPCRSKPNKSGVLVEGSLHWVIPGYGIVLFELEKEVFSKIRLSTNIKSLDYFNVCNLKGCLSVAGLRDGMVEIWVMEEYKVKKSWVKKFSIKGQMSVRIGWGVVRRRFEVVVPLCELNNGEILLEVNNKDLVSYDPKKDELKLVRTGYLWEKKCEAFVLWPTLLSAKETVKHGVQN